MPIVEENIYIIDIEYSPLIGGYAIVLNDGRAAFLTATSLKFDPNVSTYFNVGICYIKFYFKLMVVYNSLSVKYIVDKY